MNYFTHTVDDNICKWLLDNKFPLTKCIRNDHNESLYYTLPYEDSDGWQYCDAYYNECKSPKLLVETELYDNNIKTFKKYKIGYLNKSFYPLKINRNLKHYSVNITLKEI